jgi:hypothetical protein
MEKMAPSSSSLLLSPQVTLAGKPEHMGNGHDIEGAHNSGHDHHSWNIVWREMLARESLGKVQNKFGLGKKRGRLRGVSLYERRWLRMKRSR